MLQLRACTPYGGALTDEFTRLTFRVHRGMDQGMLKIGMRVVLAIAALIAMVFGSAGRWDLPFAWAYLAVLVGAMVVTVFVIDKDLVRERAKPGPGGVDRSLRFVVLPFFAVHIVVAGLDIGRYHWSGQIAACWQIAALIGLAASTALSIWAVQQNRFFSPVVRIQSERGHHVITSGPYRWVRHPGYASAIVSILCGGPALGSWWSMLVLAPVFVLTLRRAVIEDRYLHEHLEGYTDYAKRTRHRLVPGIW